MKNKIKYNGLLTDQLDEGNLVENLQTYCESFISVQ